MKVSYKHLESVYCKASDKVLISSKYHRRYKNNGGFGKLNYNLNAECKAGFII